MLVALKERPCAKYLEISQIRQNSKITNPNSSIGGSIYKAFHRSGGFAEFFEAVVGENMLSQVNPGILENLHIGFCRSDQAYNL